MGQTSTATPELVVEAVASLETAREDGHTAKRRTQELLRRQVVADDPANAGLVNQALALLQGADMLLGQALAHLECVGERTKPVAHTVKRLALLALLVGLGACQSPAEPRLGTKPRLDLERPPVGQPALPRPTDPDDPEPWVPTKPRATVVTVSGG